MKTIKKNSQLFFAILFFFFLSFFGCKKDQTTQILATPTGSITFTIYHVFGNNPLRFSKSYLTANDTIRVQSQFAYYFSNIKFTKTDNTIYSPGNFFLVHYDIDSETPDSTTITLNNIPQGDYKTVSFVIGVDGTHNHMVGQTGALDPSNNMCWFWNTGYIFYRLKGSFGAANTSFSFDLGGDSNLMSYDLPAVFTLNNVTTINLKMDIQKMFQGQYNYDLKVDPKDIHSTTISTIYKLVENAKNMMSVTSIQ
jgi:hypothetical protein